MAGPVKIGVSSCLLGEKVRYDGGHKLDRPLIDALAGSFTLMAVCPEVGCGMTTPRDAMRLEGDPARPRLVTIATGIDRSEQMRSYCRAKVAELAVAGLSGFVLKKNSPSCGLSGVKVYRDAVEVASRSGLFAAFITEHFPGLPVEDEERLNDPNTLANFIERVIDYRRAKDLQLVTGNS